MAEQRIPDPTLMARLPLTVNGTLFDFQNSTTPVVAATVDVWNDIAKLGMTPDATATTDGQGKFTITVPGVSARSACTGARARPARPSTPMSWPIRSTSRPRRR